ncbi:MAG: hypothetical protein U1C57_02180, partial [Candidatus Doudnabacteria bacterium]|nr:hypothetical protein [Candidatus Doudnabacteria bacterium]
MQQYQKPQIARSIKAGTPIKRFELTEKQLATLKTVSEVVFAVGMVVGTLALTVVAPNIFQILDKMPWAKRTYRSRDFKRRDQQRKVTKSLYYLKSKGYVELIPDGDDFQMKITQKGRKKVETLHFENLQVKRQKVWNGHWWVIAADVPKELRRRADFFRDKLKAMKFYPLQRTVWFFPFDPRDEVDFVAAYYGLDRYVTA